MEGLPMIVDMHEWQGMQEKNIVFFVLQSRDTCVHVTGIAYA